VSRELPLDPELDQEKALHHSCWFIKPHCLAHKRSPSTQLLLSVCKTSKAEGNGEERDMDMRKPECVM